MIFLLYHSSSYDRLRETLRNDLRTRERSCYVEKMNVEIGIGYRMLNGFVINIIKTLKSLKKLGNKNKRNREI